MTPSNFKSKYALSYHVEHAEINLGLHAIYYQGELLIEKLRRPIILPSNDLVHLHAVLKTKAIQPRNIENYKQVHVHKLQFGSAQE